MLCDPRVIICQTYREVGTESYRPYLKVIQGG